MRRQYFERVLPGLGRIVLETGGLRGRVRRFAYCALDGRVFVSGDLALLERVAGCGSDAEAAYLLETRLVNHADVVLSPAAGAVRATTAMPTGGAAASATL